MQHFIPTWSFLNHSLRDVLNGFSNSLLNFNAIILEFTVISIALRKIGAQDEVTLQAWEMELDRQID